MLSEDKYFKTMTEDELWQRYCGYLDLSLDEFMEIQKELLIDEIELVADSILGRKIMGSQKPKSVDEFRRMVPLTTYEDYEPYLSQKQDSALAGKPCFWCHSSGKGGTFKWIPHSFEAVGKMAKNYLAAVILATSSNKGEINIAPGLRALVMVAPTPYVSGYMMRAFAQSISLQNLASFEDITSGFEERIRSGFQKALKDGIDIVGAMASILVRMGEELDQQARTTKFSISMLHPKIIRRLFQAWLYSKREKRMILPKDLWKPKGILTGGVDTSIYKDAVAYYWGSIPYEIYAGTEGLMYAMQGWTKRGLTFLPDMVFLELIPYEECLKQENEKDYQPSTVLLNEVQQGKLYEVVITQFYGMPLLRYRIQDLIKVIALRDDKAGVNLPQVVFERRVGETINLGGLAELDEKVIWQAIANTGIKYTDWSACREYDESQTFLRLFLELKEESSEKDIAKIATMIDEQLKVIDTDYKDIDTYLKLQPVRVTLLTPGTFRRYMEEKSKEGADLFHLKPAHMNPSEPVIQRFLQLSEALRKDESSF